MWAHLPRRTYLKRQCAKAWLGLAWLGLAVNVGAGQVINEKLR